MRRVGPTRSLFTALALAVVAIAGCANPVTTPEPADTPTEPGKAAPLPLPVEDAPDTVTADADQDPSDPDGDPGDPLDSGDEPPPGGTTDGTPDDQGPPDGADPDGDGIIDAGDPGPPPADAGQSCAEWTDCAPHHADPNSGFDCVQGTCTCDDTGQWATACASIGGWWSAYECFCFTNTDSDMPEEDPEPPPEAEDDVTCWWTWRLRTCDPDEWVDTSYTERVCDDTGCWNEWVDDGYWVDGRCYGRWIKRCTDGNEYWY